MQHLAKVSDDHDGILPVHVYWQRNTKHDQQHIPESHTMGQTLADTRKWKKKHKKLTKIGEAAGGIKKKTGA